jgi:predicted RNase H-like nuclease
LHLQLHANREDRDVERVHNCAGVDGCPAGWIVVTRDRVDVVPTFAQLPEGPDVIGVDMPIGLPSRGRRVADGAARKFIGARRSSVFPTPHRDLLEFANDPHAYAAANAASKARHGTGLSRQAFNLLSRIAEVDEAVTPEREHGLIEVHPECSFRLLAREELPSKHTSAGRARRRALVQSEFGAIPTPPRGATEVDLLDAYAVLWSTERFSRAEHETLGDHARDARGLVMRIVV